MMNIKDYKNLINELPIEGHSFTTERRIWKKNEDGFPDYKDLNDQIFITDTLTLNRKKLIDSAQNDSIENFLLKIYYWGYSNGVRGDNFSYILEKSNFDKLVEILSNLKGKNLTILEYENLILNVDGIRGLGLSTFSKFLYFLSVKIDSKPCIILDRKIIKVISSNIWVELEELKNDFSETNLTKNFTNYPKYIKTVNSIASELSVANDKIELFLFLFGQNLKK